MHKPYSFVKLSEKTREIEKIERKELVHWTTSVLSIGEGVFFAKKDILYSLTSDGPSVMSLENFADISLNTSCFSTPWSPKTNNERFFTMRVTIKIQFGKNSFVSIWMDR